MFGSKRTEITKECNRLYNEEQVSAVLLVLLQRLNQGG